VPTLSIKNVPEALVAKLRLRAVRDRRSMQDELMALITSAVGRSGTKSIEQIAVEHRARYPQPIDRGPRAVNLIRADRDAR
jgi:plasmid stability protein